MKRKTVLITGASSGIGRELAKIFAKEGVDLVLVARRYERLYELKNGLQAIYDLNIEIIQADLSKPDFSGKIANILNSKNISIDYLVNNAGFGGYGKFYERNWADDKAMVNVNIMALIELTRIILPQMVNQNFGRIVNIASTAAFLPGPFQAVYYASKAFVLSFSQALAEEVSDKNIKVTTFCPTATETEFASVGDLSSTPLFKKKNKKAENVAKQAFLSMQKGELVKIDSPMEAFSFRWIFPLLSRKMILKLSRSIMEKK